MGSADTLVLLEKSGVAGRRCHGCWAVPHLQTHKGQGGQASLPAICEANKHAGGTEASAEPITRLLPDQFQELGLVDDRHAELLSFFQFAAGRLTCEHVRRFFRNAGAGFSSAIAYMCLGLSATQRG